ncbi:MAG: G1 family endopeptidase [Candidatus Bathyarchaeota archaeon]|nr:G1 family endopeptidase [Candidatus Bathyarchaeota archaeon]
MAVPQKSWKTNAFFLIILWLVLLIASLTVLSSVVTPFLRSLQTQNLISLDWSGYSVTSNLIFPQPTVVAVSASWIIPTVTVSEMNTYSSVWVGVGGQNDNTLIQVGSEHDSYRGEAVYSLWYELLPDYAIKIPEINVSPGDQISASVRLVDAETNYWLIEITDVTVGQSFREHFFYDSTQLTAEWIVERPTVNNFMTTLADFGNITFTDAKAQIGDKEGTITAFPNYEIMMQNRQNQNLVEISELNMDGSSFTITYLGEP